MARGYVGMGWGWSIGSIFARVQFRIIIHIINKDFRFIVILKMHWGLTKIEHKAVGVQYVTQS
jgi:hypothetical protein